MHIPCPYVGASESRLLLLPRFYNARTLKILPAKYSSNSQMLPLRSGLGQASHSNGGPEQRLLPIAARLARIAQVAQKCVRTITLTRSREPSRSYIPDPSTDPSPVTETPEGPVQKQLFIEREITAASVSPVRPMNPKISRPLEVGCRGSSVKAPGTAKARCKKRNATGEKAPREEGTRTERVGFTSAPTSEAPKDEREALDSVVQGRRTQKGARLGDDARSEMT